jgi:hypothetical protein
MILILTFVTLFAAHSFADHWVQRHEEAQGKGAPGLAGQLYCLAHVSSLTIFKAGSLLMAYGATGIWPPLWAAGLVLVLDAGTHYWADRAAYHADKEGRKVTLELLADKLGKSVFWNLGKTGVDKDGRPAASLGTGAYALDQSFHVYMLFLAAVVLELLS